MRKQTSEVLPSYLPFHHSQTLKTRTVTVLEAVTKIAKRDLKKHSTTEEVSLLKCAMEAIRVWHPLLKPQAPRLQLSYCTWVQFLLLRNGDDTVCAARTEVT